VPSPVLGIDLGTTNSVVAFADEQRVRVLRDEDGQLITPSCVSFEGNGRMLVGHEARERRLVDARNTIFSVKRLIGRPFRSLEVKRAAERLPFALEEGVTGGVVVRVRGETYSLPEIASFILRKVRGLAEAALGHTCTNAVITVPANFNELQRMATRDAGRIAGLNVLRILNEPTAAALAYGYRAKQGQRIAVYDLGGGTFDISILELSGDVIEVVATAGDTNLGGDDLDSLVADRMADDFQAKFGVDLARDPQQYERVRMAAEWIKCQLSHQDSAEAIVKEVAFGPGKKPLDLHFKLGRSELQTLAAPLINRTFTSCEEALRLAGVRPMQLDGVILVGGQTRTPAVRQMVAEFFGREPQTSVDPELVVAQGAALQGYALSGVPAADLASKPPRTLMGNPPAPRPQPSAAGDFEDLPTTIADRADPHEEPTKIAEYVSAEEAEAMFAAAQEAERAATVSTLMGVGPKSRPASAQPAAASKPAPPPPPPARASQAPGLKLPLSAASKPSLAPVLIEKDELPAALREAEELAASLQDGRSPAPAPAADPIRTPSMARLLANQGHRQRAAAMYAELIAAGNRDAAVLREARALGVDVSVEVEAPPLHAAAGASTSSAPAASKPASVRPSPSSSPPELEWSPSSEPPLEEPHPSPFLSESQLLRSQFPGPPSRAPLLLDVTPHTLGVETAGGFCEPIIERNAPIPTEQTRVFSTSQDDQVTVSVRVCQGESRRTDENQVLGQIALIGLRAARRGEVSIAVTFMIDADGTLNVNAVDRTTGQGQAIRVDLVGAIGEPDLERMRTRQRSQRPRS
jgi:molecular chaperone DnaK